MKVINTVISMGIMLFSLIVTNELKTREVSAELYGDNDAGAIYSEADNTNFVSIVIVMLSLLCRI